MIDREDRTKESQDPVGIVIARGRTNDAPPRFAAFVWGPVPDAELDAPAVKKASKATKAA